MTPTQLADALADGGVPVNKARAASVYLMTDRTPLETAKHLGTAVESVVDGVTIAEREGLVTRERVEIPVSAGGRLRIRTIVFST